MSSEHNSQPQKNRDVDHVTLVTRELVCFDDRAGEDEPIDAELVDAADPSSNHAFSIQSRLTVLAILFCVTGALGLPLLWMSDRFSSLERLVWSVVVTAYTILLIWGVVQICLWALAQVSVID
ncbi:hypothetical protein N9M41_00875 [Rhodopirellula sp.]|jgi:hypothetical protein|nr:hypothetical protein [Rhodopirellula sp.]